MLPLLPVSLGCGSLAPSRGAAGARLRRPTGGRALVVGRRARAGARDGARDSGPVPSNDAFTALPEAAGRAALEALFLAKAAADVANEAAGRIVGEVLAEMAKFDAERDGLLEAAVRDIQERASRELAGALGEQGESQGSIPTSAGSPTRGDVTPRLSVPAGTVTIAPATGSDAEVEAAVDDLRAEVARAAAERNELARELRGGRGD